MTRNRRPRVETANAKTRAKFTVAIHEAGHAVACVLYDRDFEKVTIEEEDSTLGHLLHHDRTINRRFKLHKEGFIDVVGVCVCAAGSVAEKLYIGRKNRRRSRSDEMQMEQIASGAGKTDEGSDFNSPMAQAIVSGAWEEVTQLLDLRWPLVEAVAEELIAKTTLSGREVFEMCKRPTPALLEKLAARRLVHDARHRELDRRRVDAFLRSKKGRSVPPQAAGQLPSPEAEVLP